MKFAFLNVLVLMTLFSCGERKPSESTSASFVNLGDYFTRECTRLETGGYQLEKTLEGSDTTETKLIEDPDWKVELDPFLKAASIKNADMLYRADSSINAGVRQITYHALDSITPLRSVTVYGDTSVPDSVLFIRSVSNMYYQSADTMFYSGSGYRIHVKSSARVGKDSDFSISGSMQPSTITP